MKKVIDKYSNSLPVTRRRLRIRQEPQQPKPTQAPPPEQPIIFEDVDKTETKQTSTNTCIFCVDSDTDSTRV